MKLKVNEIEVPADSPFTNDVLGREPLVKSLITLLTNSDTPIVFSLNAEWGAGKTVFLRMLDAQLKLDAHKSIYFSAWETDFAADPMLAFLAEIIPALEAIAGKDDTKKQYAEKAIHAGKHLLIHLIPMAVKVATGGLLDGNAIAAKLVAEKLLDEYTQAKDEISNFKEAVGELLSNEDGTTSK
ncbi:MAG: P-loop NTPase fold protein, partial [Arenicellales bacterium WSBS_2016_MAG_OTU3]